MVDSRFALLVLLVVKPCCRPLLQKKDWVDGAHTPLHHPQLHPHPP
jgi:hypothetical protein